MMSLRHTVLKSSTNNLRETAPLGAVAGAWWPRPDEQPKEKDVDNTAFCSSCRYCYIYVYCPGCGSDYSYACLKEGSRVIKIDGPPPRSLVPPIWCPGIDVGEKINIDSELKKCLDEVLSDILRGYLCENKYICKGYTYLNILDWRPSVLMLGIFALWLFLIIFLLYFNSAIVDCDILI